MRRSKTPLALMEQLVMVLVFALAAALCVQVFVLSDRTSRYGEARDRALLEAQSAAEALKAATRRISPPGPPPPATAAGASPTTPDGTA
jgi:Tfp pilus assembly protein PilX